MKQNNVMEFENNKLENIVKLKAILEKTNPELMLTLVVKRPKVNINDSSAYTTSMYVVNSRQLVVINYVDFDKDIISVSSLCGDFDLSGTKTNLKSFLITIKPYLVNHVCQQLNKEFIFNP